MTKRRHERRAGLRRELARYRWDELWALVVAAGGSPSIRARWASVGYLASQIAHLDRTGGRTVRPSQLATLLSDCLANEPSLMMLEDFVPSDPRDVVRVRLGPGTARLLPGSVERPVADVDRALLVARAIDEFLVPRKGFGVQHVAEVILKYGDSTFALLEPSWRRDGAAGVDDARLTSEELAAARQLVAIGTPPAVTPTPQHALALDWLTCEAKDLPYKVAHPQSPFGRFVRVRTPGGEARWLPPAYLPEILGYAVSQLSVEAAALTGANRRFSREVAAELQRLLWRFGPLYGVVDDEGIPFVASENSVQWVSIPTPGRSIMVQLVAGLDAKEISFDEEPEALQAVARLRSAAAAQDPVPVRMPQGYLKIEPGNEAVPLLVIGSPSHVVAPRIPGLPGMSLDDLRWAVRTSSTSLDLYHYCRDTSRADLPRVFGWEAIDTWEWWRNNGKSVFTGGAAPTFMSIAAHAGEAEWTRARRTSPLEVALSKLSLPAMRELDGVDHELDGPPVVYRYVNARNYSASGAFGLQQRAWHPRPDMEAWTIHVAEVPVAISALNPDWGAEFTDALHDISGAFGFSFRATADEWEAAHAGADIVSHFIKLLPKELGSDGKILEWQATTVDTTEIGRRAHSELHLNMDLFDTDRGDLGDQMHEAMADSIASILVGAGFPRRVASSMRRVWRAAPPSVAIQIFDTPTVRNNLASPVEIDEALVSQVDRRVAEAVREAGVDPGDYRGSEAKELDRTILAPAALSQLDQTLAVHDLDEIIQYGMVQIERCLDKKDRLLRDVRQSAAKLQTEWSPVERLQELDARYLLLRRCCETVIEAALRLAPRGTKGVDNIAWGEALAAAHAYLAATTRSEAIHHQVSPTLLRVSDSYEISIERDESGLSASESAGRGRVYDFDTQALRRVLATESLADGEEVPNSRTPAGSETDGGKEIDLDRERGEADATEPDGDGGRLFDPELDQAMLEAYGASGSDVLAVLFALARWPLASAQSDAISVTPDEAVDHILGYTTLGDRPEGRGCAEAALALLTSKSIDLAGEDWKPWLARSRKRRILLQPLPELTDGRLVVSPRLCLGSLTVYQRYLMQGQMPWSQPPPAAQVNRALESVRDRRNKDLEAEVASVLTDDGWTVIRNVKENRPERLNVPVLRTEIDIVAGKAGGSTIWLLEVKDPADVFVIADIRRALDRFYDDGGKKPSYVAQLQRKLEDLQPHAAAVASALGLSPASSESPYVVRPMFVTRNPVPAAFVGGPFPFSSMTSLLRNLRQD